MPRTTVESFARLVVEGEGTVCHMCTQDKKQEEGRLEAMHCVRVMGALALHSEGALD